MGSNELIRGSLVGSSSLQRGRWGWKSELHSGSLGLPVKVEKKSAMGLADSGKATMLFV